MRTAPRLCALLAGVLTGPTVTAGPVAPEPLPPPAPIVSPVDRPYPGTLSLRVDATDIGHRVVHVTEQITGLEGETVLLYPKWLPGNHSGTGPIARLAGLKLSVHGEALPWTRDAVDMYAFRLRVPEGAAPVDIEFDYLSPTSARIDPLEMSAELMVLDWNNLLLYPAGYFVRQIPVTARMSLPSGWQFATALEATPGTGTSASFRTTTVESLVDSPVYAGRYVKRFDLDPGAPVPVTLNVFADRPELLNASPEQIAAHRGLVQQAYRLFGSRHYAHYDFLYALSDQLAGKGLEHHQSSEDTADPGIFTDWERTAAERDLLAHEFTHSWNGKFRRPADLWTPNYNVPMRDSLLWVYEGQTEYWGHVLAARAGLETRQQTLDQLALEAAFYETQAGRQWRSLADTTNDPIINHHHAKAWSDWTRYKDYYSEGALLWLDVDTLIRERSRGARSLDTFARSFFGGGSGGVEVQTYTFDDVVGALNAVEAYDWATFLRQRLEATGAPAPLHGIRRGGYRLVYRAAPNDVQKADDARRHVTNLLYSVGLVVDAKDGTIQTSAWGSAAFRAGLTESTQILAINGIAYDGDVFCDAIRAAQASRAPIELIVRNGARYRSVALEYYDGLRYPHLERDAERPARLDDILTARRN